MASANSRVIRSWRTKSIHRKFVSVLQEQSNRQATFTACTQSIPVLCQTLTSNGNNHVLFSFLHQNDQLEIGQYQWLSAAILLYMYTTMVQVQWIGLLCSRLRSLRPHFKAAKATYCTEIIGDNHYLSLFYQCTCDDCSFITMLPSYTSMGLL